MSRPSKGREVRKNTSKGTFLISFPKIFFKLISLAYYNDEMQVVGYTGSYLGY